MLNLSLILLSIRQHLGSQDFDRADLYLGLSSLLYEETVVDRARQDAGQCHGHHHEVHPLCIVESHR